MMEKSIAGEKGGFGTGVPKGVAAPEAGNNAAAGGALVPMLTLGVPGSGTTAVLLAVLVTLNITPGPTFFVDRPDVVRVLIPSGALGLNYDKVALAHGIAAKPDIIAIDGGSTDSGPAYLGRGVSKYARESTKREWKGLMEARAAAGVPLVLGTSGICGTDSAVDWILDMTREIARELGQSIKIAVLRCSQDAAVLQTAYAEGRIAPLAAAPDITADTFAACTNIVALAGAEQINPALETGVDVVLAGRTTDTAIIAALPIARGSHAGAAWHGAKIGESGALCAANPQSGVILVDFDATGFTITPLADGAHATPHTVSAHMPYEDSEPGGHLNVTGATYTALDDTRVRVEGPLPQEVGAMGIVTAGSQDTASDIAKMLDPYLLHHPLSADEEQPSFAFPFSPVEMQRGALYSFALNHILTIEYPMDVFMLEVMSSDAGR